MESRVRLIQEGALAWTSVDIVECETGGEGAAIRAVLEQFGVTVRYFPVGQARHLVRLLGGEATAPFVIICCHGEGGGIVLPELAPEWEERQPVHHRFTAADVSAFASLHDQAVISTGCETGTEEMGAAWLDRGAACYIAPTGAPEGDTPLVVVARLFYELVRNRPIDQAMEQIRRHDTELGMWRMWSAAGEAS